ncbi:MAG: hypothetical protein WCC70_04480 [Candidatus Aquilonibacter sp.]
MPVSLERLPVAFDEGAFLSVRPGFQLFLEGNRLVDPMEFRDMGEL